jgi:putative acetyltransferase
MGVSEPSVRLETTADHAAVRQLLLNAFPTAAEADLVESLRHDGDVVIALVAEDMGRLIGQVVLSRMKAPFRALGLAPVAVEAAQRRRGIGASLIKEALGLAERCGWNAVFVLGEPAYYRRFGFDPRLAAPFDCPYAGPHLMALALGGKALPVNVGKIDYAPAFAALD